MLDAMCLFYAVCVDVTDCPVRYGAAKVLMLATVQKRLSLLTSKKDFVALEHTTLCLLKQL